jgi:hypothetical protein
MTRILLSVGLTMLWGAAVAQAPAAPLAAPSVAPLAQPIVPSSTVTTSRGPAVVTGSPGQEQSVMIPGSAVPGTLMNNGNGTSTVIVPGSIPQVVPTPR